MILSRLSARQHAEVLAFAAAEPLAERRADVRAAMLALVAARAAGAKGVQMDAFLPDYDRAADGDDEQTQGQMERAFGQFEAARDRK